MKTPEPEPKDTLSLQGRRVLVVEDDDIMAEDLKAELESFDALVLGPVPTLQDAFDRLASEPALDGAVLDINLGGDLVYPLADLLRARRIPFVFATGYEEEAIPALYADLPHVPKPVNMRQIIQALAG